MRSGRAIHRMFAVLAACAAFLLCLMMLSLLREGLPWLTWRFLVSGAPQGGIRPEILNTAVMIGLTLLCTVPIGLGVAMYVREYAKRESRILPQMAETLLSTPSVVVALVVYRVVVGWWHWPISILTGVIALIVINLPFMVTVYIASLKGVPETYREASLALGASRWQTLVKVMIPAARASLIEGTGMAAARLAGESAALIFTAGVNVSRHWTLWGPGETLAVHIWYVRTEGTVAHRDGQAAATGVALMLFIALALWLSRRVARWFE